MLRIVLFLPDSENPNTPARDCACCGERYLVKRRGMRMFSGGTLEGEICPECVLAGPSGSAGKLRALVTTRGVDPGASGMRAHRASWEGRMEERARLLEETPSFSLAARQAAVRETRERR